jgi:hypothetical protein
MPIPLHQALPARMNERTGLAKLSILIGRYVPHVVVLLMFSLCERMEREEQH